MLALDEPGDNDTIVEVDEFRFIIDKDLYDMASPISIDGTMYGFTIHSNAVSRTGGSCSF